MTKYDEQVLVVNRNHLTLPTEPGLYLDLNESIEPLTDHIEVKRRGDMEENPQYKQLVSYVFVKDQNDKFLIYERLSGGGEERLHGQLSMGVGGHMNPQGQLSGLELLTENTLRELKEELGVEPDDLFFMGFINDDTDAVGQVHLGLAYAAVVSQPINVTETDTLKTYWIDRIKQEDYDRMENWSKLSIDVIQKVVNDV